jgi:hypothetical protein
VYEERQKMAIEVFNRYEDKFLVDTGSVPAIEKELNKYMELDKYNKAHGFYTISNLYYDTDDSFLIRNSLSKPHYKEKLRLRAYGIPSKEDKVYMEIKKKFCGRVNKRRTEILLSDAYQFAETGKKPELKDFMNKQIMNEIEYFLCIYTVKPRLYLAYDRRAFFCRENRDLRITFDSNIRTRRDDLHLENGDYGELLLGEDRSIMEIKAANSFPVWLAHMLSDIKAYRISFSKYGTEYSKNLVNDMNMKGEPKPCLKPCSEPQPKLQYQSQMQF